MTTRGDAVEVVRALVDVGAQFNEIARRLRERPEVLKVHTECWMRRQHHHDEYVQGLGEGEGMGIQWYAEADLAGDARVLSFSLEVSWDRGQWRIQADARAVEGQDYDVLVELPTEFATEAGQLLSRLAVQRARLADRQDEAVGLFLAGRRPDART